LRRAALFGAGRRGLSTHVVAIAASPSLELDLVVDLDSELPRVRSEIGRLRTIYPGLTRSPSRLRISADGATDGTDWRDGLMPDIAFVATPHGSHVPLAYDIVRNRVPVVLEKPPAMSAAQLKMLIYESEQTGIPIATLMPARHLARFLPFRRALESTRAGTEIELCIDIPFYPGFGYWRTVREQSGGGVLFDLGYHVLDLVVARLGKPSTIDVCLTGAPTLIASHGVDTGAEVWLYFEAAGTSVHAILGASSDLPPRFSIAVNGIQARIPTERNSRISPSVQATLAQVHQLLNGGFIAEAGSTAVPQSDLQHHLEVMELMDLLYFSARWIEADVCAASQ